MASSASSSSLGAVTVVAETTDAAIDLSYDDDVPRDVTLKSTAKTSGGSKVTVTHPHSWQGSFSVRSPLLSPTLSVSHELTRTGTNQASTVVTHTATLTSLSPHSGDPALGTRHVSLDTDSRSRVAGTVRWDRSGGEVKISRSVIETDGPAELVLR